MGLSQIIAFVALMFTPISFPMDRLPEWLQGRALGVAAPSHGSVMRAFPGPRDLPGRNRQLRGARRLVGARFSSRPSGSSNATDRLTPPVLMRRWLQDLAPFRPRHADRGDHDGPRPGGAFRPGAVRRHSSYSAAKTREAARIARARHLLPIHQPSYNMFNRRVETGGPVDACERGHGCGKPNPTWEPWRTWFSPDDELAAIDQHAVESGSTSGPNRPRTGRPRTMHTLHT